RVGQVTPVHLYTSGDEAELFLNGKSLGRKKRGPRDYRLRWDDVVYQPGTLKAVVYKKGKRWAEDTVATTGQPAKLLVSADRARLRADGKDLSFVTVTIADKDGRPVPRTHDRITFKLSGPGEIVATDNGDATDLESFQSPQRKAFNGLALAIVKTKAGEAGKLTLTASADGLEGAQVTLDSLAQ
ncbi:beta-galactosidase, putative, partial [Ricinus communis]